MQIKIDIYVPKGQKKKQGPYTAHFKKIRSSKYLTLGWVDYHEGDADLRFPAILIIGDQNKQGYIVYTPDNWQEPLGSWGDLANALDWALIRQCGIGRSFYNCTSKHQPLPGSLNISALDLPLSPEQQVDFDNNQKNITER